MNRLVRSLGLLLGVASLALLAACGGDRGLRTEEAFGGRVFELPVDLVPLPDGTYLLAQPVAINLQGPANGALVANASFDWSVVGPAACAGRITARLTQDGGAAGVYAAGTPVEAPGSYTLRVDVPDCAGDATSTLRSFRVNGPPIADAVPDGHPQADPAAVVPAYIVDEAAFAPYAAARNRDLGEGNRVAATAVYVPRLVKPEWKIEIEAIAART